jgi:membrane-associated phospholipid phosphatase
MTVPARARGGQLRFIAALIVLPAIWLTMLIWGRGPVDRAIYAFAYVGDNPVLVPIARGLTTLGEPTILIAASFIVALVLWLRGHRHLPLVFIAITMFGRALSELQKYWIGRPRPDLETHLVVVKTSSFPSGHANSSMIFFLTLALVATAGTKWQRPAVVAAIVLSLLVGVSRVMLGVHWPSDVVGGWALGMLWVLVTLRLAGRFVRG